MTIRPCDKCADLAPRKFFLEDDWVCVRCVPPRPCGTCGEPSSARIERYAVENADDDTYRLAQTLLFLCEQGHTTIGPTQEGPSAITCVVFRTQLKADRSRGRPPLSALSIANAIRRVLEEHPSGLRLRDLVPKVQALRAPIETSSAVVSAALQSLMKKGEVDREGHHRKGFYKLRAPASEGEKP